MAICLEGYSSHCSFMERHKALVAACDISGDKEHGLLSGHRKGRVSGPQRPDGHPCTGWQSDPHMNQRCRAVALKTS